LPALFVDRGDGGGAELQQFGQQDDLALVFGIPRHDAAQQVRIVGLGFDTGEADELVGADLAVLRDLACLGHFKGGVSSVPNVTIALVCSRSHSSVRLVAWPSASVPDEFART
jgi:hypothetical protein